MPVNAPSRTALYRLLAGLLLAGALILGWRGWQGRERAVVEVTWSTASELDTAGFHLYRAASPQGPFTRLNAALIPAAAGPLSGGEYRFEDREARPGRRYYYRLEEVENSGAAVEAGLLEIRAGRGGQAELAAALALLLLAAGAASRAGADRARPRPAPQAE